jgi:HK97 gp10 family phage protein
MSSSRAEIRGMRELQQTIKELGKLPQKCVTKAARNGAKIAQKDAKINAPVDQGNLKRGIVLRPEKSRTQGKKVFQVTFNRNMNEFFVKVSKDGKRAYYPASMEYGYFAKNGRYIPGYRFMRKSIDNNEQLIEDAMIDVLAKEIDKLR